MSALLTNLYYLIAYGLTAAALLLSFHRWRQRRTKADRLFFIFMVLFTAFGFQGTLATSNLDFNMGLYRIFNAISLATIPAFIYAMPAFTASLGNHYHQKTVMRLSRIAAVVISPLPLVVLVPNLDTIFYYYIIPSSIILGLAGVYCLVRMRQLYLAHQVRRIQLDALWVHFLRLSFWFDLILLPLILLNDLFQLPRTLWKIQLPGLVPLLGASLGASWLFALWRTGSHSPRAAVAQNPPSPAQGTADISPVSEHPLTLGTGLNASMDHFRLSPREQDVAKLLLEGLSYQAIAERLFIAPGTVKTHVLQLYQKTGTRSKIAFLNALQGSSKG